MPKFEILHSHCEGLVFYCDHLPFKGEVGMEFTHLNGHPVVRGEIVICPKCKRNIMMSAQLTNGNEVLD